MIKKIIFDIDNTLIEWEEEKNWKKAYNNIVKKFEISQKQFKQIQDVINNYERVENIFNEETMQKMINNVLQKEYPVQFIQTILNTFAQCVPEKDDIELKQTLQYLSNKYEIVALTNWFGWQQEKRLQKYGILKYFKNVYGADKFKAKPNKQAYNVAIGQNKPEECIMVGDGIENDVKAAIQNGLTAILLDSNYNKGEQENNYKIIKNLKELQAIL